ncbi:MAG: carboxymuconolactone decarboxylase family protein [Phycisphaerales bacterium JB037]
MPRLNVVDPATAEGRAKELFEGPLKGMHANIFKGIANSGAALDFYVQASGALKNGLLTGAEREVIQLTIAQANDCDYCLAAHTAIGKMEGLSEDQTVAARKGTLDDAKLAALSKFAGTLHEKRGWASDDDLAAFKSAGYTDGHVPEVIAGIALAYFTNYFNHTHDTEVDFPAAPKI